MLTIPNFTDRCSAAITEKGTILICGLDPQLRYMPAHLVRMMADKYGRSLEAIGRMFYEFNKQIIDAVEGYVFAVKPQMAFYEAYGVWGIWAFQKTVDYARKKGLIVIEDAKRGDGGDTAVLYAAGHIGEVDFFGNEKDPTVLKTRKSPIRVDCITVQPGIGSACILPFAAAIKQHGTGIFVVDKSSFDPNSEVEQLVTVNGIPVWRETARLVRVWQAGTEGSLYGYFNMGVVMGATFPNDAVEMREELPMAWFLIPGYGGQGGTAAGAVVGINKDGLGGGVNNSRGIIFAFRKGQF
ncbi:MAG: orotidine-5'-phosphate decarboxylase, partial [Candidatus Paceibacterota bacterium]